MGQFINIAVDCRRSQEPAFICMDKHRYNGPIVDCWGSGPRNSVHPDVCGVVETPRFVSQGTRGGSPRSG